MATQEQERYAESLDDTDDGSLNEDEEDLFNVLATKIHLAH